MILEAVRGIFARARNVMRTLFTQVAAALGFDTQDYFSSLPLELQIIIVNNQLRSNPDPLVVARQRLVSHAWRDAIDATGWVHAEPSTATAAERGWIQTLQHMLLMNRLDWNVVCKFAAMGGRLGTLQWARLNGCPWDENTCKFAAGDGHLQVLEWAIENGCPC